MSDFNPVISGGVGAAANSPATIMMGYARGPPTSGPEDLLDGLAARRPGGRPLTEGLVLPLGLVADIDPGIHDLLVGGVGQ